MSDRRPVPPRRSPGPPPAPYGRGRQGLSPDRQLRPDRSMSTRGAYRPVHRRRSGRPSPGRHREPPSAPPSASAPSPGGIPPATDPWRWRSAPWPAATVPTSAARGTAQDRGGGRRSHDDQQPARRDRPGAAPGPRVRPTTQPASGRAAPGLPPGGRRRDRCRRRRGRWPDRRCGRRRVGRRAARRVWSGQAGSAHPRWGHASVGSSHRISRWSVRSRGWASVGAHGLSGRCTHGGVRRFIPISRKFSCDQLEPLRDRRRVRCHDWTPRRFGGRHERRRHRGGRPAARPRRPGGGRGRGRGDPLSRATADRAERS